MARAANTRAALEKLLGARNEHPERIADIDAEIERTFAQTHAIFVLDMCGFSRLTMRYGITHFLAMIQRLHTIVRPIIKAHSGAIVKTDADNVFAVFPDVPQALAAAEAIQAALRAIDKTLPADWDLYACVGIGYGPVLMIQNEDMFGSEMNLASKLGEDVAGPGKVLLTEAAYRRAPEGVGFTKQRLQGSGLDEACYLLRRPRARA